MEKFNRDESLAIIKAAAGSGTLKLLGPETNQNTACSRADIDSAYLIRLLQRLQGGSPHDWPKQR